MDNRIGNIEKKLQELFEKIDFSNTYQAGRIDVNQLSTAMLEFTKPAHEIIQRELQNDSSNNFKHDISELIKKYRTAIALKYSSGVKHLI